MEEKKILRVFIVLILPSHVMKLQHIRECKKKNVHVTDDDYIPCERTVQVIIKALKLSFLTDLVPTAFINEIICFCHLKGATSGVQNKAYILLHLKKMSLSIGH